MSTAAGIKIVFLGDSGVGKTSIISQYVSGVAPKEIKPTIGAAFMSKEINFNGVQHELKIWDTAGQEVYRGLAPMYYRSASIAFIVFDITKSESYNSVKYWIEQLKDSSSGETIAIIVGNKVDVDNNRTVSTQDASKYASDSGAKYIEVSARTGFNIERMFQLGVKCFLSKKTNGDDEEGVADFKDSKNGKKGSCC